MTVDSSQPDLTKKSWFGSLMGTERDETHVILIKDKPLSAVKADLIHAFLSVSIAFLCCLWPHFIKMTNWIMFDVSHKMKHAQSRSAPPDTGFESFRSLSHVISGGVQAPWGQFNVPKKCSLSRGHFAGHTWHS